MSGERTPVDSAAVWPEDADADEGYVVNWFVREEFRRGDTLGWIRPA